MARRVLTSISRSAGHQAVQGHRRPDASVAPDEQVVLSPDGLGTQTPFRHVVVDAQLAVARVGLEIFPLRPGVRNRLADRALRQNLAALLLQPLSERVTTAALRPAVGSRDALRWGDPGTQKMVSQKMVSQKMVSGQTMGRVALGDRSPKAPTDPDVPVKEASGSSSHDFATLPTKPWTTRARGRLYRFSRRRNLGHVIGLPRRRRDSRHRQIRRAPSRNF